jgi:hypothetical protein
VIRFLASLFGLLLILGGAMSLPSWQYLIVVGGALTICVALSSALDPR